MKWLWSCMDCSMCAFLRPVEPGPGVTSQVEHFEGETIIFPVASADLYI